MFCSHCGVQASGNFCYQCGSRLSAGEQLVVAEEDALVPAELDWRVDPIFENVVSVQEVRAVIASSAKQAIPEFSAEQLFDVAEKVIPIGVSYSGLAAIAQPMWASLGVRTGKDVSQLLPLPIGLAMVRAMCSLARHKQKVEEVEQHDDGCTITAELPSSIWAMKGELKVRLAQQGEATQLTAAINIPGQAFDWGRSQSCLQQLLSEMRIEVETQRLDCA